VPSRLHFIFGRLSERHDIHVVHFRPKREYECDQTRLRKEERLCDLAEIRVSNIALHYSLNSPLHLCELDRIISKEDYDAVVHANVLAGSISVVLGKSKDTPIVFEYLDHFPQSASAYYDGYTAKIIEMGVSAVTRWNIKKSNHIITVSEGLRRLLVGMGARKVSLVPNGVDPKLFRPMDKYEARRKAGLPEFGNSLVVGYVGSIERWIDLDTVLKAIMIMEKRGQKPVLLVVGGSIAGPYSSRIAAELSRHIVTGFVPYEKVPLFINSCDTCLLPLRDVTKNRARPLKLYQYLACERPVFSLPNKEIRDYFPKSIRFFRTAQDLADLLQRRDFFPDRRILKEGRIFAKQNNWDDISLRYERSLMSVLV
jgi:glycosyltransferase involved in cell wall biosynthesis